MTDGLGERWVPEDALLYESSPRARPEGVAEIRRRLDARERDLDAREERLRDWTRAMIRLGPLCGPLRPPAEWLGSVRALAYALERAEEHGRLPEDLREPARTWWRRVIASVGEGA